MIRFIIFSSLLCLLFFGCKKEYSYEGGLVYAQARPEDAIIYKSEWEFKESAVLYKGPVDTAFLTKESGRQVLTINGKTITAHQQIKIIIANDKPIATGTFSTSQLQVKFFYTTLSDTLYAARPYFGGDMYVSITEIDDRHVAGTFMGVSLDKNKKEKNIIEGKFSSPLKKSSNPTGSVLLWASEQCSGTIKVKVNDLPGEITTFPYITPECGEAGSASFNLKPGTYRWVAYCTTDSISGTVNVNRDSCSKIKVTFPFKPAAVTYTSKDSCVVASIRTAISSGLVLERKNYNISAQFFNNKVSAIKFPVIINGFQINIDHDFVYTANAINVLDGRQNFVLDASGRVKEYTGLLVPDKWDSQPVVNKYFYDAGNHLVELQIYKPDGTPIQNVYFKWSNGNIISMKAEYLVVGGRIEIFFDYYMNKRITSFPFLFFDVPELFLFQPGLNFGAANQHALKSKRFLAYNANNNLLTDSKWIYESYIMDANNYIQSMTERRDDEWGVIRNWAFTYHCF